MDNELTNTTIKRKTLRIRFISIRMELLWSLPSIGLIVSVH